MNRIAIIVLALLPSVVAHADQNFASGTGSTWDCAKDPNVNINHGAGTYTFKGACKTINLNGGASKLTIESVESLNVNGAANTVAIGEAGDILINGAKNTITWKKAKTGDKPAVTQTGVGNKVSRAK